jgi:O-antigen/teichoic acid export membrane protein
MAAVVGVIILSPELSRLLGGKEFAAAALPMSLLMIGNYFVYLNSAYANALLATDHQNILLRITMYNLAINLALNLVLIPLYGTAGAAASVAVTEATQLIYLRFHFRKLINDKHFQLKLPLLMISATAMALTVWFVKSDLAAHGLLITLSGSVLAGAFVYLGLVLLLKIVTLNEVKEIMRLKRS